MGDAIMEAHRLNQEVIALQKELIEAVGLPPHEHPPATVDPLAPDDLRPVRRAAARGQADRDEGRAERGDASAPEHDHQGAGAGRRRRGSDLPAEPDVEESTQATPPPARFRPTRRSRRPGSRPRSARSRSGSSAS